MGAKWRKSGLQLTEDSLSLRWMAKERDGGWQGQAKGPRKWKNGTDGRKYSGRIF